jgi:Derlin-2/3
MAANIHQGFGGTPQAWYASLPPITKLYGTACVATTVATMLGLVSPMQLIMHWPAVIGRLQVLHSVLSWLFTCCSNVSYDRT